MRKFTEYENYLYELEKYYRVKNIPQPEWIRKAWKCYSFIFNWHRYLNKIADGSSCSISKNDMKLFSKLKIIESIDDIPEDLKENYKISFNAVQEMYNNLITDKDRYFICEWTLSKAGRKLVRQYQEKIGSALKLKVPQNNFTSEDD